MTDTCDEMRLLVQADHDGELTSAEAARVGSHIAHCAGCGEIATGLRQLSGRLRAELPRHRASAALRDAVQGIVAARASPVPVASTARRGRFAISWSGASFGSGFALAACLGLLFTMLPGRDAGLVDAVVAGHIRSLQPGHLMDVASTDQHTVKPWFDGRLDFAPPVRNFAAAGFPLIGGRLDYLDGREIAALLYRSRQHVVQLFIWPSGGGADRDDGAGVRRGYNYARWSQDAMTFWVVSDLNAAELDTFVRLWRRR